jgi:hypothetical protein
MMNTCKFNVVVVIQEDILRFDVSVDDGRVQGVKVVHCSQHLTDHHLCCGFI